MFIFSVICGAFHRGEKSGIINAGHFLIVEFDPLSTLNASNDNLILTENFFTTDIKTYLTSRNVAHRDAKHQNNVTTDPRRMC